MENLKRACKGLLILLLAVPMHPWFVRAAAEPVTAIYALEDAKLPLPEPVLRNRYVEGVALRYFWDELEPSEGVFAWSKVDTDIARARSSGKRVSLSVTAGVDTPSWVYGAGAAEFRFVWNKSWGKPICSQQRIPIPWDSIYLAKWRTFVHELGHRYNRDTTVALVKITGLNSASQETNLPHLTGKLITHGGMSCTSWDDVSNWKRLGYTSANVKQAWETIVAAFAESFPNTQLVAMITPAGFPLIDGYGVLHSRRKAGDALLSKELMTLAASRLGARLILQNNGLSAFWAWREPPDLAARVPVAYQMLWSVTGDRQCRMNRHMTPCDPRTVLQSAINRGLERRPVFLEIYIPDILNPDLQAVLAGVHDRPASGL